MSSARPTSAGPPQPRTVREMLDMARGFLGRKGVEEARLEADLLVAHALDLDRLRLLMRLDQPVQAAEVDRARDLLVRRGRREPVAYITGAREFYARSFAVAPGVLVPRPETELLVDLARDAAKEAAWSAPRILDVGTGSGCLAVTLALEVPGAEVAAVDVSTEALAIARANAERLGGRVTFHEGDGLEIGEREGPWHIVVSNPPYVAPETIAELAPEVRDYEPSVALFAPAGDPDHWARELAARAPRWLVPGGALFVELGFDQSPRVAELATRIHRDLAGVDRVLEVRN